MYQLLRTVPARDLLSRQLPSFSVAFVIASAYFRFGSFALESMAFLATWAAIDAVVGLFIRIVTGGDRRAGRGVGPEDLPSP